MSKRLTVIPRIVSFLEHFISRSLSYTTWNLHFALTLGFWRRRFWRGGLQSFVTGETSPSLSLGIHLFKCKTCPAVLQLQHSLPPWYIFSSFELDSDIYVHLLSAIVRHLEGRFSFFPLLLPHLFPFFSPDRNINADLHATVTKPLMNNSIFGNPEERHLWNQKPCNGIKTTTTNASPNQARTTYLSKLDLHFELNYIPVKFWECMLNN